MPAHPNLIQLTATPFIHAYLVMEADGLTLIDGQLPHNAPYTLKAMARTGLPLRRVLLTHAHLDHVGCLDAILTAHPQAEQIVSERAAPFLRGDYTLFPNEHPQTLDDTRFFSTLQHAPAYTLKDGERVGSLQMIATPGHSPDHVAWLDTRDGMLIAGDAFQAIGGLSVIGVMNWLNPLPTWATWNRPLTLDSAIRLRNLQPTGLAVGHGGILANPLGAMDRAIAHAQRVLGHQA